jgi:hypothetical protein
MATQLYGPYTYHATQWFGPAGMAPGQDYDLSIHFPQPDTLGEGAVVLTANSYSVDPIPKPTAVLARDVYVETIWPQTPSANGGEDISRDFRLCTTLVNTGSEPVDIISLYVAVLKP